MASQMMDIRLIPAPGGEDLATVAGDFSVVESTSTHQQELILNNKGDFKQNPTICVGAFEYLDDENFQNLIREISIEFTRDGMDVKSITMASGGIVHSDAFYA